MPMQIPRNMAAPKGFIKYRDESHLYLKGEIEVENTFGYLNSAPTLRLQTEELITRAQVVSRLAPIIISLTNVLLAIPAGNLYAGFHGVTRFHRALGEEITRWVARGQALIQQRPQLGKGLTFELELSGHFRRSYLKVRDELGLEGYFKYDDDLVDEIELFRTSSIIADSPTVAGTGISPIYCVLGSFLTFHSLCVRWNDFILNQATTLIPSPIRDLGDQFITDRSWSENLDMAFMDLNSYVMWAGNPRVWSITLRRRFDGRKGRKGEVDADLRPMAETYPYGGLSEVAVLGDAAVDEEM